ncbi:glycoside hydrolase family 78 protein [Metabacillus elymi]|uniref:alpha-L-rhamnosidase n=1 Tax=Metabacillus elymi TaxID=2745198 RepID=A0ABX6RZW2_9BACI|nr:glycoside hydrolase family 78 protein [Metabacillus sp. KUDC1714]QNF26773.1 family 78 glycoside hydrolase catalytic domain [Metabacillus sp. KUDC1714]
MRLNIYDLRVEYTQNPLGIDTLAPKFDWILDSTERSQVQTSYQILVSSNEENLANDEADMWVSGVVESDQSIQIVYQGKELQSSKTYFWKVRVWDKHKVATPWSQTAYWSMGLLDKREWKGQWIGAKKETLDQKEWENPELMPSAFLRKEFSVSKSIESATMYITALGLYELHLNNQKVGDAYFAPGWTDYNKRVQYQTYDVTNLLKDGENTIGTIVGTGWYAGHVGMLGTCVYGEQPYVLVQMNITYKDGSVEQVVTDQTWKTSVGPILYSDIIKGEYYDARLELDGWSTPGFNDSNWQQPLIKDSYDGEIVSQLDPPVRVTKNMTPIEVSKSPSSSTIFDMGQNMIGWAKLTVSGEEGTKITLRYAEMLERDGSLYTENLRRADPVDYYILSGHGVEQYEPHFTYHGFRYVEVICEKPEAILSLSIEGKVVHSDTPETGYFETSNEMVNQLYSNITWGQRGNFLSIPTDCPQRDERLGWTGDAQIFIRTASFNMDVARFFTKYVDDMVDAQLDSGAFTDVVPDGGWIDFKRRKYDKGETILRDVLHPIENWLTDGNPGWGDAGVVIPWTMYQVYGDKTVLVKHYEAMSKWIAYLEANSTDFLRPNDTVYGDWLSIGADTPKEVLSTAYFAYSVKLMAKIAHALDKKEDEKKYSNLFENIKISFNKAYITSDGKIKGDTQTVYVLALNMGLVFKEQKQLVASHLVDNIKKNDGHLSTGFLGVGYLLPVLTENGYTDVAYDLLNKDTFPSWLYSVKHGATTIWERWDGWTDHKGFQSAQMNSFNHYSLGSVGEWMFRYVAGIDVDSDIPGYKKIKIQPKPGGGLTYAKGEYQSVHGKIKSEWKIEKNEFTLKVSIPVNTEATVYMPGVGQNEDRTDVQLVENANSVTIYQVGSGEYEFVSKIG